MKTKAITEKIYREEEYVMRTMSKLIFILFLVLTPTLQMAALEKENERFKQELLEQLREEIKHLPPDEISKIVSEFDKNITDYIEYYEETPKDQLLTKDELYLQQHRDEVSPEKIAKLQDETGKSEDQLLLEELNPKLAMFSDDDYHYNAEAKEIEFTVTKDDMFNIQSESVVAASAWSLLVIGHVPIDFDKWTVKEILWARCIQMIKK